MRRDIRIIGVKRKEVDEEKLALAFLLLAKHLHDTAKNAETIAEPAQAGEEAA